ncbi:2-dehydro-3-deoxy-D-gluconate 5-dehydrogenase KduD [Spirochaetia bacterium 38H-sp]|uniref:2-dehydro-3-deoxy-D-gluconate 5-dehydrogenase KduD n=1 Tax=Rarispira pelagica TaxID=3141764 RepID=A0ABU9UCQ6_9SPIR
MNEIIDKFRLDNKVAIVTGCSRGLGQGMALALAKAGADIVGISSSDSAPITGKLVQETGRQFLYIKADLSSTEPVSQIISKTIDHYGQIDILINNAGITRRSQALYFSEKDWDDVININLRTLFFLSQAFARYIIKENKKGKIINIASMLSFQGGINVAAYTASKSAVKGLTMALANEWAQYNINVNAIAPGYMITDITSPIRKDSKRNREISDRIPAGRWGTPEDLAGAVVFLASEASDYVNGHTLAVDGGWLAR